MKGIKAWMCECGKPACPPSKVLCKEHLEALSKKMHALADIKKG